MKRFHVHLSVADLPGQIRFYSQLFGQSPSVTQPDYAKWMLDDPAVNFAISARGAKPGLDHLGFQVGDDAELGAMRERLTQADMSVFNEGETTCCYARSDKHWVTDLQGTAWETFRTLGSVPTFNAAVPAAIPAAAACCPPEEVAVALPMPTAKAANNCAPKSSCC